ncbi:hypothetical protein BDZ91DRAFT_798586 [Kalaharituber pfeilii]|nr:hypothetical protein BDZ91DRAFT_798586 [Kalaharituber pfeilii]
MRIAEPRQIQRHQTQHRNSGAERAAQGGRQSRAMDTQKPRRALVTTDPGAKVPSQNLRKVPRRPGAPCRRGTRTKGRRRRRRPKCTLAGLEAGRHTRVMEWNRIAVSNFNAFRLERGRCAVWLKRIGAAESDKCRCREVQTGEHLAFRCRNQKNRPEGFERWGDMEKNWKRKAENGEKYDILENFFSRVKF